MDSSFFKNFNLFSGVDKQSIITIESPYFDLKVEIYRALCYIFLITGGFILRRIFRVFEGFSYFVSYTTLASWLL